MFKAKDAFCALVKEGISHGNRNEAYQLAKEVDLFDAEFKELEIRQNLIREKWKWLTLEKKHSVALTHKENVAECNDKKEEAVMIEDVADMTMMEDEIEIDQVGLGSCDLQKWMEEPHDDDISTIDNCVSFQHLVDGLYAGKGKINLLMQGSILPWMSTVRPCMEKQGLLTIVGLVRDVYDLMVEGAKPCDKGGT